MEDKVYIVTNSGEKIPAQSTSDPARVEINEKGEKATHIKIRKKKGKRRAEWVSKDRILWE